MFQEQPVKNYYKDRTDQLKLVSTRLLMFEFQLLKKQKEIETILLEKEQIITQQQRIIAKLKRKLHDHHIETDTEEADLDDDVINPLEKIDEKFENDNDSDSAVVMEDSDCVSECPSSSSSRYSNSAAISRSVSDAIEQPNRNRRYEKSGYTVHQQTQFTPVVSTYNRVMSNHRSVTKPKDVKYKRINKAKSKSLEELRDKLKNWLIISND